MCRCPCGRGGLRAVTALGPLPRVGWQVLRCGGRSSAGGVGDGHPAVPVASHLPRRRGNEHAMRVARDVEDVRRRQARLPLGMSRDLLPNGPDLDLTLIRAARVRLPCQDRQPTAESPQRDTRLRAHQLIPHGRQRGDSEAPILPEARSLHIRSASDRSQPMVRRLQVRQSDAPACHCVPASDNEGESWATPLTTRSASHTAAVS